VLVVTQLGHFLGIMGVQVVEYVLHVVGVIPFDSDKGYFQRIGNGLEVVEDGAGADGNHCQSTFVQLFA